MYRDAVPMDTSMRTCTHIDTPDGLFVSNMWKGAAWRLEI